MSPLERLMVGVVLDIRAIDAWSGGGRVTVGALIDDFLRSFVERPLLSASTDLFIGFTDDPGITTATTESEVWRKHVRKVIRGPKLVETAAALFGDMSASNAEAIGSGIAVRARWALILSSSGPKLAFGATAPSGADQFGQDLVPVLVGTHGAYEGYVWGREALEVRPELLPHFLGDVTAELQRCLWGVSLSAESDGGRFRRWMSGAGRAEPGSTASGRAGSAPDLTINPEIEISVRGGWRPVE